MLSASYSRSMKMEFLTQLIISITAIAIMVGKIADAVSSIKKARMAKKTAKTETSSPEIASARFTFREFMEWTAQLASLLAFLTLAWWMLFPPANSAWFSAVCGVAVLSVSAVGLRQPRP